MDERDLLHFNTSIREVVPNNLKRPTQTQLLLIVNHFIRWSKDGKVFCHFCKGKPTFIQLPILNRTITN